MTAEECGTLSVCPEGDFSWRLPEPRLPQLRTNPPSLVNSSTRSLSLSAT